MLLDITLEITIPAIWGPADKRSLCDIANSQSEYLDRLKATTAFQPPPPPHPQPGRLPPWRFVSQRNDS